ncbi:flagellar protein FlaG [Pontibacillus sp. HMF3514]|uniref:flagellar protein FlaG n=1 Tax=Pontibacillus sp. HMF3514 TaxID=2692425 RepID=UPI00131FF14D|nr:flagellar protein FlaG [Pontibacillus sp. HMF3514]QHE53592.1 flagellar protein FlaG [Pontibacillus sp. HMF3514]
MDVGNILSGSQLLQRAERIEEHTTSYAETRSELKNDTKASPQETALVTKEVDRDEAKKIVESMNEFLGPTRTELAFKFHDKLEEYYVSIVNPETDEVIKEIPPKKLLDMYAAMAEFMGFIVDEKV